MRMCILPQIFLTEKLDSLEKISVNSTDDYAKDGRPGVPGLLCSFYHEPLRS